MDFINGERMQEIADIYLGTVDDLVSNPYIFEQIEKHQIIDDIFLISLSAIILNLSYFSIHITCEYSQPN